ncbi:MAG: N-acetyltransferase [Gemmatimonadota bacterium]|nr:N-acetyltransferase [Gemmatimonadota bacterium]
MTLRVDPVDTRRDLKRFIGVPWHIYDPREHPQWVPPLRAMVKDLLDTRKNPFYERASIRLWVARRDGRVVGRVAAIENRAHNEFHDDKVGFFGFFEAVEDPEVARLLLDTASGWLAQRGLTAMRGPMSPSTNHDCGMLVRGFRWQPSFMTTWNPRYYPELMDACGMVGVKDLLAYYLPNDDALLPIPEGVRKAAARVRERGNLSFRSFDKSRFEHEVAKAWEVYNGAWEKNWGFIPVTEKEFWHQAKDLKPILDPDLVFFAEDGDRTVGIMMVLRDLNFVLKRIPNGRLLPTGIFKLLFGWKKVLTGRLMLAGILPEYRHRAIFPLFIDELKRRGQAVGAVGADASWILEDNEGIHGPLRAMGAKVTRRWRIYERPISSDPDEGNTSGG